MVKSILKQCWGKNFITERNYKLNSSARNTLLLGLLGAVGSGDHCHPRRLFETSTPNIVPTEYDTPSA
jgi:hypothetical protein